MIKCKNCDISMYHYLTNLYFTDEFDEHCEESYCCVKCAAKLTLIIEDNSDRETTIEKWENVN